MLTEAKRALSVTVDDYDAEIAALLMAGAGDLEIAGVQLPGTVTFSWADDAVVDCSTLTDPLCVTAILTYARMRFKQPKNYEQLRDAYETQKVQLMHAAGYTGYESGGAG